MIRFALFLFLVYVFYRLLKSLFGKQKEGPGRKDRGPSFTAGHRPVSEMVQDPVCKVYVPKKEALELKESGTNHYFCCRECMDKFRNKDG